MIVILLLFGLGVGINIGLWIGKHLMEKLYDPLIESYRKDVDYWFDSYMKKTKS